ncbi:MAG: hypothetical protein CVV64_07095 [Candidatus Wallbacteria bacterium HGW-Wallbacteria-1]|jgi:exopolyphosphatase/guanosine-5'-triphosphate,3'-diphosphate pyrophosphatase|uniref:Ppx/GppA phosphatase N-terminal domain-containing protein n=1 Tax=Candidatus Wallbacteria bacterium HGW-Wallbacteria-1 TaxID=2013854 RepID=A0A2N1PT50_9BACT|nr:MAG: hypothetical protein CVV64_07095 [Candidatus Wallbacteria bacterium HGW-Wallbacteria-1]
MIVTTIDIGTNSVRMLAANCSEQGLSPIMEDVKITRIGEGLTRTGSLTDEAIARTIEVVEIFVKNGRELGSEKFKIIGTAALRTASNGTLVSRIIKDRLRMDLEIISGEKEAELVLLGLPAGLRPEPGESMAAIDIGGGSSELICIMDSFRELKSINIGCVKLSDEYPFLRETCTAEQIGEVRVYVRSALEHSIEPRKIFNGCPDRTVALGGTATTAVLVTKKMNIYVPEKIHGSFLSLIEIETLIDILREMPVTERCREYVLNVRRGDVFLSGLIILSEAMRFLGSPEITVSHHGILHGAAVDCIKGKNEK